MFLCVLSGNNDVLKGVKTVWVASPKPAPITLAAAYVAGADALLRVGGAHAIAAFAHGAGAVPKYVLIINNHHHYCHYYCY